MLPDSIMHVKSICSHERTTQSDKCVATEQSLFYKEVTGMGSSFFKRVNRFSFSRTR